VSGSARTRNPWLVIAAYAVLAAATQMLWLTYAPITTGAARHYGVSEGAIGWLAELFPLLYVALALPAGIALDRWFGPALLAGAALTAVGGVVRLGGDDFGWVLGGQVLIAVGQPLVLNAVTKLAGEHFDAAARPTAVALGSAGIFVGMILGFVLGPALGGADHIRRVLVIEAVLGVVAAVAMLAAIGRSMTPRADGDEAVGIAALRRVWADPFVRSVCGVAFVGFGVFIALTTWLQSLLHPAGVSDNAAGAILVGAVVAGVVTTSFVPAAVAARSAELTMLRVAIATIVAGCIVVGLVHVTAVDAVAVVAIGAVVLPALPVLLELAEGHAGTSGASAAALLWMAGNLGGLVLAVPTGALVHHRLTAFVLMAGFTAAGLTVTGPLARSSTPSPEPARVSSHAS
jgi:predicted MFS family arabinose efflux permease